VNPVARVAFATSSALPDSPPDDRPAIEALRARGVEAVPAVWDSPSVRWAGFDAVVVRSTWDYQHRAAEFLRWVDRVSGLTSIWNPAPMIRWNHDKRYLIELARAGFDVVPTERLARGSSVTLRAVREARAWEEVVVKPAVGASGHGLMVVGPANATAGEAHLARLLGAGDALLQPFMAPARELGERSLVFLGGRFSHAVAHPLVLATDNKLAQPLTPSDAEVERAGRIAAWLSPTPLYARLDFLPSGAGSWLLGELELIEPELFFRFAPAAADRFAELLLHRLARP
jgi:hypothetical protein